jgi:Putative Ig domain
MNKQCIFRLITAIWMFLAFHGLSPRLMAEKVGIFSDQTIGQIQFVTGEVKKALESKGFTSEEFPLTALSPDYPHKKIVVALANNAAVTKILEAQGGEAPIGLGEQAYELISTPQGNSSYWVLGGDENGAMYGGLQIAENIIFEGYKKVYNNRVSPGILRRGAKLNMAFDRRLPTYAGQHDNDTPSIALSIRQVWNINFWKDWIDQQARNRYNVLTVWNHNPFPALVSVPGFEKSTLDFIQGEARDPFQATSLTLEKRQQFWKDVMQHAKKRGFDFYFFNWNVTPVHVQDVYPDRIKEEDIKIQGNKDYLNSAIKELLETYPDLDGFGVSPGDAMPKGASQKEIADWVFDAYSKGLSEYAEAHQDRKFTFIHRMLKVDYKDVYENWKEIVAKYPNLRFDCSLKYCMAYTYSTTTPEWAKFDVRELAETGEATWVTLRNDGFFYADFGDPEFIREFIGNLPSNQFTDGLHKGKDRLRGFYLGHDTYSPTYSYLYKDPELNLDPATGKPMLEIQRKWYMEMLWGRIGYDRGISNEVFVRHMGLRYPSLSPASVSSLFKAWSLASRSQARIIELVQGEWKLDSHFYTEFCMYKNDGEHYFRTIRDFLDDTNPANGSEERIASIKETAEAKDIGGKTSSYVIADELEENGMDALRLVAQIPSGGDKRVDAVLRSVQIQGFLSLYYAHKVRGATHLGVPKDAKRSKAKDEMFKAYGWWMHYINAMEALYNPEDFRTYEVKTLGWRHWDKSVLAEYQELGGEGTPPIPALPESSTAPVITSAVNLICTSGLPITYATLATNTPTEFSAKDLPKGLSIDPATGVVSGNIAAPGKVTFSVNAANQFGVGSQVVKVEVQEPLPNTAPKISNLPDFSVDQGKSLGPISFTVKDRETPAASLIITATSSDESLVPASSIVISGSGENRAIMVTPLPQEKGDTTITVTVSDGALSDSTRSSLDVKGTAN